MSNPSWIKSNICWGINPWTQGRHETLPNGWVEYHNGIIFTMVGDLTDDVLPKGYTVRAENSIQRKQPDVHIHPINPDTAYQPYQPAKGSQEQVSATKVASLSKSIDDFVEAQQDLLGIGIYYEGNEYEWDKEKPVAWIEVLSPTNKKGDALQELVDKRNHNILAQGITYAEIDLLPTGKVSSTHAEVPVYSKREPNSRPFNMWYLNMRVPHPPPLLEEQGRMLVGLGPASGSVSFGIGDVPPRMRIPLLGKDTAELDFSSTYNRMFIINSAFGLENDYTEHPPNVEQYNKTDQYLIAAQALAIRDAVKNSTIEQRNELDFPRPPLNRHLIDHLIDDPDQVAQILGLSTYIEHDQYENDTGSSENYADNTDIDIDLDR